MIETLLKRSQLTSLPRWRAPESQIKRYYCIHALPLKIVSDQKNFWRFLDRVFGYFLTPPSLSTPKAVSVNFYGIPAEHDAHFYNTTTEEDLPAPNIPHVHGYVSDQCMLYRYAHKGTFFVDPIGGHHGGYITTPYSNTELRRMFRSVVLPVLFNLLRMQGLFPIHAAAAAAGDRGIVITGESGRGKTTLLLHLLHIGCHYMADDILLLRAKTPGLEILSVPMHVRITPQTADMFAEFRSLCHHSMADEQGKYAVDILTHYHQPPALTARPACLLFPEISSDQATRIQRMSAKEVVMPWMHENTFASKTRFSRDNFAILSQLIQTVPCYKVWLGRHMTSLSHQLEHILGAML